MKTKILSIATILFIAITISSCKEEVLPGKATFWNDSADGLPTMVVIMDDGSTGVITSDYSSSPDCGASGCYTYEADPGTYGFVAGEQGGTTWSGTVTITDDGCVKIKLHL